MNLQDPSLRRDSSNWSLHTSENSTLLPHHVTSEKETTDTESLTTSRFVWFTAGIFFSAAIAHISTSQYYSQVHTDTTSSILFHSNHYNRAQSKAIRNFQEQLLIPTRNAELYYNGDTSEMPLGMTKQTQANEKDSNTHTSPPPPPPPEGCEATILLFRHCEAGPAREHCGYMGYQRSNYFATLFGDGARYPKPSYIYALAAGERHKDYVRNWREIETVQPLADKVNVPVNTTYGFPEKGQLANDLYSMLRSGEMCGKVAILSWKHHDVPDFTHEMGCGPEQGCPLTFEEDDYDSIWQLKYVYHKELHAPYSLGSKNLKGKEKKHPWWHHPQWFVYGVVKHENFDPLAYSFKMGTYEDGD